jgi:hypothetical protein
LPAGPRGGFATEIGAKIWSKTNFSFFLLQAPDFPQNGQRNLWKYLEKTAADLEMFGADWEKLAGREVRQGGERAFSGASPSPGRAGGSNAGRIASRQEQFSKPSPTGRRAARAGGRRRVDSAREPFNRDARSRSLVGPISARKRAERRCTMACPVFNGLGACTRCANREPRR